MTVLETIHACVGARYMDLRKVPLLGGFKTMCPRTFQQTYNLISRRQENNEIGCMARMK